MTRLLIVCGLLCVGAGAEVRVGFEEREASGFREWKSEAGVWSAEEGHAEVSGEFAFEGEQCLRLRGGKERRVSLSLAKGWEELAFRAERWTARDPFDFRMEVRVGENWNKVDLGKQVVRVGARFLSRVKVGLPKGAEEVRWVCSSPEGSGLLVDDVRVGMKGEVEDWDDEVVVLEGGRKGLMLRGAGQDGVHTYRIPGLATTNRGTLIAVYDNRYRGGGDLPGDIDVGMSRSTDGGETWEAMKVIMDMGNDPKWRYDGVGDPSVLVDRVTNTIWVAGTWSHGNRSWHGSGEGMAPEETGQLMLVKSEDDGVTWSDPMNMTKQVKKKEWRFVLQGPGKGITLRDGTLVFPMQFRGENSDEVKGKPFSSMMFSKDRGVTWTMGTGVKIDTTEAQVVELGDGRLMINCRDNRGGARSVYTTSDLGMTWEVHPTSRKALPEPVCMASLVRVEHPKHGALLLFSNPNQTKGRARMTLKVSRDEGMTWPSEGHHLIDARGSMYSCLTQIGEDHVGLLYEGTGGLIFVKLSLEELLDF